MSSKGSTYGMLLKRAVIVAYFLGILIPASSAARKPNIIFIFTDDMGSGDLGCYGGDIAPTPHIDRLAEEGTKFTQFYVASPICSPSRAGVLTGMHPARWRIYTFLQTREGNRKQRQDDYLDPAAPSVARALQEAGYVTAHIGKWHLGGGRDVVDAPPFSAYGYDEYVGTYESPEPDPDLTATNWIWSEKDKVKRWDRTAYMVDETLDFLERNQGKPCFVNLWPDDVHRPWIPEGSTVRAGKGQHESRRELELVLAEYDRQVGRLMAGIQELGVDEETMVVFTSDNGPGPDFEGNPRSLGMRGRKGSLYEGGTRMPFIVRWPGKIPAGRVDDESVISALDLFPTFCKLGGGSLPKGAALDGYDVSVAFTGQRVIRQEPIFWSYGGKKNRSNSSSMRDRSPNVAVRDGKWKLLVNADGTGVELYNLETDREESVNLAAEKEETAARLRELALAWRNTLP